MCTVRKKYVVKIKTQNKAYQEEVHQVMENNQEAWMKLYIGLNRELRAKVKNDFEKDLFFLMNNAIFGKTMENVRKSRTPNLWQLEKEELIY